MDANDILPFSAFDTVGFETITGMTPGAFEIASKCTKPIRPHPITPTLTTFAASFSLMFMDKVEPVERTPKVRKAAPFWKEKARPSWLRAVIVSKADRIFMVNGFDCCSKRELH
jgi:hypothetical protein